MLYTASYQEPAYHHGLLLSVSRSIPKGFKTDGKLEFLIPCADLLVEYQATRLDEAEYIQCYREQIKQSWLEVKAWLDNLDPEQNQTLLCWEPKGKFCHRNLVAKLVQKYRPDCFGGSDVIRYEVERCHKCSSALICGLDASYCPTCKTWWQRWLLEKNYSKIGNET